MSNHVLSKPQKVVNLVDQLEQLFLEAGDKQIAQQQEAYMKNKFDFCGLPKSLRAQIHKEFFKINKITKQQELFDLIKLLWAKEHREFHYTALELAYAHKKLWLNNSTFFDLFEDMIRTNSWWDSVDFIAPKLIGTFISNHPSFMQKIDSWPPDNNIWIKRSAIIFQLNYKKDTDENRLFSYCQKLQHEKDFFIRKAIGWALRQYSKVNPINVKNFVENNRQNLSNLSIKEALRLIE